LVHRSGDVDALKRHIRLLHQDRELLNKLRCNSICGMDDLTWGSAGQVLLSAYLRQLIPEAVQTQAK
jgi:hypothetical protein